MPTEIRVVLPTPGFDEVLSVADDELSAGDYDEGSMGYDVTKFNDHVEERKNEDSLTTCFLKNGANVLDLLRTSATTDAKAGSQILKIPSTTRIPDSGVPSTFEDEEYAMRRDSSSAQTVKGQVSDPSSKQHQICGSENFKFKAEQSTHRLIEEEKLEYQRKHSATQTDTSPCARSVAKEQQKKRFGINPKRGKSRRSAATAPRLIENYNRKKPKKRPTESVQMSLTGTYDLDLEHHDIMVKALNSYKLHYNRDAGKAKFKDLTDDTVLHIDSATFSPREKESGTSTNESTFSSPPLEQELKVRRTYDYNSLVAQLWANNFNIERGTSDSTGEHNNRRKKGGQIGSTTDSSSANFKLAHCRLIYNDTEKGQQTRPKSAVLSEKSPKSLDSSGGVLVDSVGHVYGHSKPRPWSSLPHKFSSFLKTAGAGVGSEQVKVYKRIRGDNNHQKPSFRSGQVKVVTLQPPHFTMAQPITRSVAFNRRNRTTFSWADSAGMSQSLPNASFLHKQYTCSQPRMGPPRSASPTSRAGKPSFSQRPNSSYSYDGGFFLGAHAGQAEYFVIHPDWVSEALTIRKLNGNKTDEEKIKSFNRKPPQRRWSDRRCLSAPPPKFRNPITWDATGTVNIPSV